MVPRYDWRDAHKDKDEETRWYSFEVTPVPAASSTDLEEPYITDDDDTGHYTEMPEGFPYYSHSAGYSGGFSPWVTSTGSSSSQASLPSTSTDRLGSAWPDHTTGSSSPTSIGSNDQTFPSSTKTNFFGPDPSTGAKPPHGTSTLSYVVAGMVPVVVLFVTGAFLFFCLRKKRKQKQIEAAQARVQQMKARNANMGNNSIVSAFAQMASPPAPPRQPSYTGPPNHPPPTSSISPLPVILGPISSGTNGNYMTGIDTSDVVSITNDRTGLGDPFADGNSLNEEPPPPYRPRSVAPLSRDTSLREPHAAVTSETRLVGHRHQLERSPFDDPEDDDAISDISGPAPRRNRDDMSAVSDLSYQQDPVVRRPAV